ncbi:L-lactate dehydrogenase [Mesoplasma lactucae]|uniref:L-lactate dehydrogenase n=1 Tax=Mesoplasma lactucae ATCC 49193 TaxID=81460 RepID=A0A291IRU9_9MOLU|nr:L-lactate dehydrogenase [Mesoplasma lactucae]ATG97417.1 L-lactate dehydrogenase [Mesoplasma lactucae ATCC 49193]ATZ20130.1 L-lactate dehydrogenase [Mesoplasma lactucae ATCC 49193]MCL8216878.1 L-lactate dehydrogenase 1 [Mesoplasma lactucae ATCC 49193]
MKNTANKVVLIGAGAVGTSFLYSAINQGIASDYVLIDAFPNAAKGNALDLADTAAVLPTPFANIKAGDYSDCKDADVVVITAGRPQQPGETRLDMVAGNAQIMKSIAEEVKKSGFDGITIIASNPVDVLTLVYQEVTGFDAHKVIGSGTTLDSARLRRLVGEKLGIAPTSVETFLMGEHGDSSVAAWSHATVMGQPISKFVEEGKITEAELDQFRTDAINMAYKIIELKRATFYGIGACLTRIVKAVLNDEKSTLMVGAKLNGEYGNKDLYTGVPAVISRNGWDYIIEWDLTKDEQAQFNKSCETLTESIAKARAAIK